MNEKFIPGYLKMLQSGEFEHRVEAAREHVLHCDLCAHQCNVNRHASLRGAVCLTGDQAVVNRFGPQHDEKRPLSGHAGSGVILFSSCTMRCVYCERWEVSQKRHGWEMSSAQLAGVMLRLQELGCHNVNFIASGHMVMQILEAVWAAAGKGLDIPLAYQSCGYDSVEALRLLDGVVDIYAPSMKFGDSETARRLSGVDDYVEANQAAVQEMYRQVGDLILDDEGVAQRGLIVRHLVLPDGVSNSDRVLSFVANELSVDTYLDLGARYHPCYRAAQYPELDHDLNNDEFKAVMDMARGMGFHRMEQRGNSTAMPL